MEDQKKPPISNPPKPFVLSLNPDGDIDLFIVDLNSSVDHELDMSPIVRLSGDFFHTAGLCILGSTLYVFEGLPCKIKIGNSRSVYKFELLLNLPFRFKVDKDMLVFVCCMMSDKHAPCAIPTPDGKQIMVCSSIHDIRRKNFELFDPAKKKCKKLPNIGIPPCRIAIVAFLDKSVLFVQTMGGGMYTLKFVEIKSKWEQLVNFHGAASMREGKFAVVSGVDICLTEDTAYDIDDSSLDHEEYVYEDHKEYELENAFQRWNFFYPNLSSFPPFDVKLVRLDIIPLVVNDLSDYKFGILHTGVEEGSIDIPHLILDVYSCDLVKCRSALSEFSKNERLSTCIWSRNCKSYPLPHTSKVKTLKFRLGPQPRNNFAIHFVGFIPQV